MPEEGPGYLGVDETVIHVASSTRLHVKIASPLISDCC